MNMRLRRLSAPYLTNILERIFMRLQSQDKITEIEFTRISSEGRLCDSSSIYQISDVTSLSFYLVLKFVWTRNKVGLN